QADAAVVAAAQQAGARLETGAGVRRLLFDGRGRACGVELADGRTLRADVVVDASGPSSRLGEQVGLPRRQGFPMGVAVRSYLRTAPGCGPDPSLLHSWLALQGADGVRLPGYGWIFPLGDGLFNVGVGQLSTSASFRRTDYRALLQRFVASLPPGWGMSWVGEPRPARGCGDAGLVAEATATPVISGAALPMGFDRAVAYRRGVLLVGDAAGLVNPFNGEGVSYALESGLLAGRAIAQAADAPGGWGGAASERALQGYHHALADALRGYYRLGRGFTRLIAHDAVMRAGLRWVLPHPVPMAPVNRLMANLLAETGGGPTDRVVRGLQLLARAV
ncbi:MAG: NAD(P)/FAD-dependent oxidoreductase, partial [Propionibacteriaceae bacterium]|nr:NAD(P)/FAD-dependent oxidoreductase [Propionibacteriaceae bacterium]